MAKNSNHHVVHDPNGGWSVKKEGASRAMKRFDNKQDAITYGKTISKNQGGEIVIHNKDGTIRSKDSYNRDPSPPRDRDVRK